MKGLRDKKTNRFVRNLEDKTCPQCGKMFHPRFWNIKYCSIKCRALAKTKNHNRKCIQCSKEFWARDMKTRFCSHRCYGNSGVGGKKKELNNSWKGGITSISKLIRTSKKYLLWAETVIYRDDCMCIECGSKDKLQVHHIIPFASILEKLRFEQGIDNLYEKAMNYELLWDTNNGKTLCLSCHKKTDTYLKNTQIK